MERNTLLSIEAADAAGSKYDAACKQLFQNREIVAPVLKEVVPEYKDSTVEEIIQYIDADSIRDNPVDDVSARIAQLPTEMESVSDKLIRYDTHFKAVNPHLTSEHICIHLHIDLEVQNDYKPTNPKYPIVKRGIYYAAREISYQLGILSEISNYADIEKVYSIWICNENIPVKLQNTVTMYSIKKSDVIGKTDEPEEDYDLMSIIIIRRGNDEAQPIFEYLSGVFECDKMKIAKYVDISKNDSIMRGMANMVGLGESIAKKNREQGVREGREQGVREGREQGVREGREQGVLIMGNLISKLLADGRTEDAKRAAEDEGVREKLLAEYGLHD